MSSTTTYTCDFCNATSREDTKSRRAGLQREFDSFNVHRESGHVCERCWARGVAAMRNAPAPTSQADIDDAVATAVAPLQAEIAQLKTRAAETEQALERASARATAAERGIAEERKANTALEGELNRERSRADQAAARAKDLDRALGQERDANSTLRAGHADREVLLTLAVELADMIGKKSRKRNAARLAEIELLLVGARS